MSESHFLWPQGSAVRAITRSFRLDPVTSVEARLASMLYGGHPVLCSSGRSAIVLALIGSGLSRADTVNVFPYANHCVLDAVSRIATPSAGSVTAQARVRIFFHQWGYVQRHDLQADDIEDCADTLAVPGCRLFPGGGAFEIWSLPKILGTMGGGVLWCKSPEVADRIRYVRDARRGATMQWVLRLLGSASPILHAWWQGGEGVCGRVSRLQTGEIGAALGEWPAIVADRRQKVELAWSLAPSWLSRSADRLPCAVPALVDVGHGFVEEFGLTAGMRTMEKVEENGMRTLVKLLPIPIHQDVSLVWLRRVLAQIAKQPARS